MAKVRTKLPGNLRVGISQSVELHDKIRVGGRKPRLWHSSLLSILQMKEKNATSSLFGEPSGDALTAAPTRKSMRRSPRKLSCRWTCVLQEIFESQGAAAALARYEQMRRAVRWVSRYDIGEDQVLRMVGLMMSKGEMQGALTMSRGLWKR